MLSRLLRKGNSINSIYNIGRCYVRNKYLNKTSVSSIELINTLACNAKCKFCSNHDLSPKHKIMPRNVAFSTLEDVVRLRIPMVIFIGGESLLDKNLFDYFEFCNKHGVVIQYMSNGTLLTEDMLDRFMENNVYCVCITLHDGIAENHDSIVGVPGALDTIVNAFRYMKKHNFTVSGKCIYSRESLESGAFTRIVELCRREDVGISANPYLPVGGGLTHQQALTPGELDTYYETVCSQGISDHVYNGWHTGCIAGKTYFGILPQGQIIPCYFLPLSVGNITEISLADAIEFCSKIPLFSKRHLRCPVAETGRLHRDVIQPLYEEFKNELPVDLTRNPDMLKRVMALEF